MKKTAQPYSLPKGAAILPEAEILPLIAQSISVMHHGICIVDQDDKVIFHNAYFLFLLGKSAKEVNNTPLSKVLSSVTNTTDNLLSTWRSHDTQTTPIELQIAQHPMHHNMWMALTFKPIYNNHQQRTHTICIASNITSKKMQEELQYKAFHAIAKDAPVPDIMTLLCQEAKTIIPNIVPGIYQFTAEQTLLPLSGPEIPETYHAAIHSFLRHAATGAKNNLVQMQEVPFSVLKTMPTWQTEAPEWITSGLQSCWVHPILSGEKHMMGALIFYCRYQLPPDTFHQHFLTLIPAICALVLERAASRTRIQQLAYYDALTGLANRSLLKIQAAAAIEKARQHNTSIAVLFIDLDRFKQVNDALGHHAGDVLLKTIANRLRQAAADHDIVCRLSGDEFVMVFTNCDKSSIVETISRLQHDLTQECQITGVPVIPSASLGVSMYPENGQDIDTLIQHADMAMYLAKKNLRGSFGFFSEEMNTQAQEKRAIENALRQALSNDEIDIVYQPQVNFKHQTLYGVEALARWNHPQWGNIPPDQFIAIAEECGLIHEFTSWLLNSTYRQIAEWRKQQVAVPCVAINLSGANFHEPGLSQQIINLLGQYQLSANDIVLEITETVFMDSHTDTNHNIAALHAHGIRLCIDDFGTGYSSLSYLRKLPVSILKLDKSFIQDIVADATITPMIDGIMRIGEGLHLTILAEGVENQHQYDVLAQRGCDVGQGYLFSPALSAKELEKWISAS